MHFHTSKAPIWSLTAQELARECRLIAEFGSPAIDKPVRDEARRLYEVWMEAQEHPADQERERSRKAELRAGLRKRTVEILVKLNERDRAN